MSERNRCIPAVYLLLRRGDEVLLQRRQNTGYYDGWYEVTAGHVEHGELPTDAVLREAREEIGIELERSNVRCAHVMYRTKSDETGDRLDYFFEAKKWSGEPTILEAAVCDDLAWFSLHALPENVIHHIRYAIESVERGEAYSENAQENLLQRN